MFCRRAWQRVGPLARKAFNRPCRNVPVQHMSSGVPGNSNNMTYFILCGGGLTAAVIYAYKTVNGDTQRYEERLANMGTTAKAVDPPVETPPVEEVITESVLIPVEPVAETDTELAETIFEEAAAVVVSEVLVTEATVEPAVTEETTPPAAQEVASETALVTVETPAEAPAVENTGSVPDLLTAVKILAGSTVEIAAASVGEKSLINAVQQIQEDGKGLESTEELVKPDMLEATTDLLAETATEEELNSADTVAVDEVTDEDEGTAEEISGPALAGENEVVASFLEETTALAPTAVELGEVEDGAQAPNPNEAHREALFSIKASLENVSPSEETPMSSEAPMDETPAAGTPVEEAGAEASVEESVEAAQTECVAVVDKNQLAAASTASELEVLSAAEPESEAKHCHSCNSASLAVEEVAPPTEVEQELVSEGVLYTTHDVKEVTSLVTKTTEPMMVKSQS